MGMNIYVGNLAIEVTEQELRQEFLNFGKVAAVILMNDSTIGSGQCRGCGYVEMPSESEGQTAISQLQGKLLKGRRLDVIKALPVTRNSGIKTRTESQISGFARKSKYWGVRVN
jgi:RNA recognition motif-containing protein